MQNFFSKIGGDFSIKKMTFVSKRDNNFKNNYPNFPIKKIVPKNGLD